MHVHANVLHPMCTCLQMFCIQSAHACKCFASEVHIYEKLLHSKCTFMQMFCIQSAHACKCLASKVHIYANILHPKGTFMQIFCIQRAHLCKCLFMRPSRPVIGSSFAIRTGCGSFLYSCGVLLITLSLFLWCVTDNTSCIPVVCC